MSLSSTPPSGAPAQRFYSSLRFKLPVLLAGIGLTAALAVGVQGYMTARDGLTEAVDRAMTIETKAMQQQLQARFDKAFIDLANLASGTDAKLALKEMNDSLISEADVAEVRAYYTQSATPAERADVSGKDNKTVYSWRHSEMHKSFRNTWDVSGYGDAYVVNVDGRIVYSVTKSDEFLANVKGAALAGTALADAYSRAVAGEAGQTFTTDFAEYRPSGTRSMFLSTPVFLAGFGSPTLAGAVILRIDSAFFEEVIGHGAEAGEVTTYVLGADGRIRSDLPAERPVSVSDAGGAPILAAAAAGEGFFGDVLVAGKPARASVLPLTVGPLSFAVVQEQSLATAYASITRMRQDMTLATLATLAVLALVGTFFGRTITNPLGRLVAALRAIADHQTDTEIPALQRRDEIGEIGRAVLVIKENAVRDLERRQRDQAAQDAERAASRRELVEALAGEFQQKVGGVVETVSRSAEDLRRSAEQMVGVAAETEEKSAVVAQVSESSRTGVDGIAMASDGLFGAIQEISRLIVQSSEVAVEASRKADATTETVRSLNESAERIGVVLALISEIAGQTNLLALNATIEAARAGAAGKGFAVVAAEVKTLATQTAKATEEIAKQVEAIQQSSSRAATAITDIGNTVDQIKSSVGAVAAAVEEQTAATEEIRRNTRDAAAGSATAAREMAAVQEAARTTGSAVEDVARSAAGLSQQAAVLDREVRDFLVKVRAA